MCDGPKHCNVAVFYVFYVFLRVSVGFSFGPQHVLLFSLFIAHISYMPSHFIIIYVLGVGLLSKIDDMSM